MAQSDNEKTIRRRNRFLLVMAAMLWGLAGICVKSISWGSMSIITVRSVLAISLLFAAKRSIKLHWSWTNIGAGAAMAVTGILYIIAIKLTTAGTAIVLQYIAPILVFLYAVIFQGRKAKLAEIVLTFLVFAGCVLAFADSIDMTHVTGNVLAVLSGFTFAAQILLTARRDSDPMDCSAIGNIICFFAGLPFFLRDPALVFDAKNVIWILVLGIFQYGLPNILFNRSIKKVDKVEASLLLTIEPIFNPIPVAIFCGEKMGALALVGAALVIVSVTLHGILPELEMRRAARKEIKS